MKSKRRTLEGNIANQKYEAARNIERHLDIIHNTNATPETTDWRKGKAYFFRKNEEGLIIQERKLNEENVLINDRLVKIQDEDRGNGVSYAPGLQVGKGNQPPPSSIINQVIIIIIIIIICLTHFFSIY